MTFLERFKGLLCRDTPCRCTWRLILRVEGTSFLKYDTKFQVFYLELPDHRFDLLYCPSCGKRIAPLQPGEGLTCRVEMPADEKLRLEELTRGLATYDEVAAKLGPPDVEVWSVGYQSLSASAACALAASEPSKA